MNKGRLSRPVLIPAILVLLCQSMAVHAASTPPPRPQGSASVRIEAGVSKEEQSKLNVDHHHPGQINKDVTKDDTAAVMAAPGSCTNYKDHS